MSKYRIDAVEIAGFKAFTAPQKVSIGGRTTFILGENGLGKSSIIEAIVWCLYGTETDVRNKLFQGPCVVNLYLSESGVPNKIHRIQRRMHQVDNQSDVDVYLADGSRQNVTDFIPQLKKLEHGPGTRVIFAEQEPGRRYSHDFNDFEGLLAAYLGLDVFYSLIEWLDSYIASQEEMFETQVRSKEKTLSQSINLKVQSIHDRLNVMNAQPPWESQLPPSEKETGERVRSFLGDVSSSPGQHFAAPANSTLEQLLVLCSSKIKELEAASKTKLQEAEKALAAKLSNVASLRNQLRDVVQKIGDQESVKGQKESELAGLFSGKSETEIRAERDALLASHGQLVHHASMIKEASFIVNESTKKCPICEDNLVGENLKEHLENERQGITAEASNVLSRIESITGILENADSIKKTIEQAKVSTGLATQEQADLEGLLSKLLEIQQISPDSVESKITELGKSLEDIRRNVTTATTKLSTLVDQLLKFQRTAEYHKLNRSLSKLADFVQSEDRKRVLSKIAEFDGYIHSLKLVRVAMEAAYLNAFSSYIPVLEKEMTSVYQTLTKQKSFDAVRIINQPPSAINKTGRKMILQVGSPLKDVWVTPDREKADVLNGQASSALNLVPYFAFARMGLSKHEIDFLLIDDPSQSFDTSHVEFLLELLKSVADISQVIVATHERDRIEGRLSSYFGDYNILNVDGFTVDSGPHISAVIRQPQRA